MTRKYFTMQSMLTTNKARIAVVGAGIAGAACARALRRGGFDVQVFDKSRGPVGRLATRRLEWVDRRAQPQTTRLDHGAFALAAHSTAFRAFVDEAVTAGWMSVWVPAMAAGSSPLACGGPLFVPVPDMPSLCRRLLEGVQCTWSFAVDSLQKGPSGWFVQAGDDRHPEPFDAVLLALPPAQAAPLLGPHHTDWARHASVVPMQPCWTLMGIAHAPPQTAEAAPAWDLAQPPTGPLAWSFATMRARPGRAWPGRPTGSCMPERDSAVSTSKSRPPGCSSKCRPRWPSGSASPSTGTTASCIAGAMPCRQTRPTRPHESNPVGGTLPKAWACVAISWEARASRAPGCPGKRFPWRCAHLSRLMCPRHRTCLPPSRASPLDEASFSNHHLRDRYEPTLAPPCVPDDCCRLRRGVGHHRTGPGPSR